MQKVIFFLYAAKSILIMLVLSLFKKNLKPTMTINIDFKKTILMVL